MEHRTEDTTPADPILEIMEIVTRISGIQLTPEKRTLVETRLTRRALSLGLKSQAAYFIHFNQNRESEIHELVSTLTLTRPFRETPLDFRTEFFRLFASAKHPDPGSVTAASRARKPFARHHWQFSASRVSIDRLGLIEI